MYTSFFSCLFSWLTLMRSSALQWQITQRELELKMIAAVAEFWKTCKETPHPTCILIAEKHGVPLSTFKACILGWPSKINAAAAWQKIHPCEEEVLVAYLKETSCWGFPDTRRRCVWRANEILCAWTGNPSDHVSHSWLDCFLCCHKDDIRCYWSTTLTTVHVGALNAAVVDDWMTLLENTIKDYSIDEDCIFSMDETCCFLDKRTSKTWHIGSAKQLHQLALRNEVQDTATLIPIISASGNVFKPTIIFKGEVLRGRMGWSNPLDGRYGHIYTHD